MIKCECIDWCKENKKKFCVAVLSVVTGCWLVINNQMTVVPPVCESWIAHWRRVAVNGVETKECVCESCAVECSEECEVCEVMIVDGMRMVCRKDQCELFALSLKIPKGGVGQKEELESGAVRVDKIDQ
mgnify:FL=1